MIASFQETRMVSKSNKNIQTSHPQSSISWSSTIYNMMHMPRKFRTFEYDGKFSRVENDLQLHLVSTFTIVPTVVMYQTLLPFVFFFIILCVLLLYHVVRQLTGETTELIFGSLFEIAFGSKSYKLQVSLISCHTRIVEQ